MNNLNTILGMIETEAIEKKPMLYIEERARSLYESKDKLDNSKDKPYEPKKERIHIDFKLELIEKEDGSYKWEE